MDMPKSKILQIKSLLYDYEKEKVQTMLSNIDEPESLYVYSYNYNWDNGFQIPQLILNHDKCCLSIALLIFYSADGVRYLLNKLYNKDLLQWFSFIERLYYSILEKKYKTHGIQFKIPLSKIQLFKLQKILTQEEKIFIKDIEGENLDITL